MGPKQALKAVPKKNNKPNQNKANKNFTYLLTHVLVCWGPSTICLYMMYAPIMTLQTTSPIRSYMDKPNENHHGLALLDSPPTKGKLNDL